MKIHSYQKRTWAEVSIDRLQHNYEVVRRTVKSARICCVIKANAYGHGAEHLAWMYQDLGADYLAVSNIEEALQLRSAGIYLPILILGYSDPECAERLVKNNLTQCVFSKEYAELLSRNAMERNVTVKVHIKVDTGMGRLGFNGRQLPDRAGELQDVESVYQMQGLRPEGIFTHFASADEGEDGREYTYRQFRAFCSIIDYLSGKGIDVGIRHCANSAAIFNYPEMHLDMVRAGLVLFGMAPSEKVENCEGLEPALELITVVNFVKEIEKGESVSYGRTFTAKERMKVATLPIGYADGFWRSNSSAGGVVEINGAYAPIIGRVCMDQCMVDVSKIPNVKIGTQAKIYGYSKEISINRIAEKNGTINYEVLCSIGERVPRIYIENGSVVGVQDNIVRESI